jgi:hypothetical protein
MIFFLKHRHELSARTDISTLIVSLNSNCPCYVNNVREALAVFVAEMIKVARKLSSRGEPIFVVHLLSKLVAGGPHPGTADCHRLEKGLPERNSGRNKLVTEREAPRRRGQ